MIRGEIVAGDLLYHAVHGLCRIDKITKQKLAGKEVRYYSLVPKLTNRMKARFTISAADMEASGFHLLVSLKEANKILDYFKAGDRAKIPPDAEPYNVTSFSQQTQTWGLAQAILSFSHDKFEAKDQRKRQALERSAKGLVGELAFVFNVTLKETAARVQKSLGSVAKINPSVLTALANACED